MTTVWIRADGTQIHSTSDPAAEPPGAATSTEIAPESGKQVWNFTSKTWKPLPPPPPSPNSLLDTAIGAATTLGALKAVLLGKIEARR